MTSSQQAISIPQPIQGKMAPILFMMILLILLWLSNTGKLTSLIGLFTALPSNAGTGTLNPMPVISIIPLPNSGTGTLGSQGPLPTIPLNPVGLTPIGSPGPLPRH